MWLTHLLHYAKSDSECSSASRLCNLCYQKETELFRTARKGYKVFFKPRTPRYRDLSITLEYSFRNRNSWITTQTTVRKVFSHEHAMEKTHLCWKQRRHEKLISCDSPREQESLLPPQGANKDSILFSEARILLRDGISRKEEVSCSLKVVSSSFSFVQRPTERAQVEIKPNRFCSHTFLSLFSFLLSECNASFFGKEREREEDKKVQSNKRTHAYLEMSLSLSSSLSRNLNARMRG